MVCTARHAESPPRAATLRSMICAADKLPGEARVSAVAVAEPSRDERAQQSRNFLNIELLLKETHGLRTDGAPALRAERCSLGRPGPDIVLSDIRPLISCQATL